jgi:hypothetical protein
MRVKVEKKNRDGAFGTRVVDTENVHVGLMIVRISEGAAMSEWNACNPSTVVAPGDSIVEANGRIEPWEIMEEMAKAMTLEMVVRRATPEARAILARAKVTDQCLQTTSHLLKCTRRAGSLMAESCAICLEDLEAEERVAGLGCGHGFHQRCLMRWLARPGQQSGCPLCRESVDVVAAR